MSVQYTFDSNGKTVDVFVPLQEWEQIKNELKKKRTSLSSPKKQDNSKVLSGIKKGLKQINQIEKGKLKSISLKQLLDEL
jgi:hypothetical protein